eukprot:1195-Heterococcus_DN1.PRE.2
MQHEGYRRELTCDANDKLICVLTIVARSKMWTASNIDNHFASNATEHASIGTTVDQSEPSCCGQIQMLVKAILTMRCNKPCLAYAGSVFLFIAKCKIR